MDKEENNIEKIEVDIIKKKYRKQVGKNLVEFKKENGEVKAVLSKELTLDQKLAILADIAKNGKSNAEKIKAIESHTMLSGDGESGYKNYILKIEFDKR